MVRSADASPCRQRDDTFASASPSSPAGAGAANVVSAPEFSLLLSSPTDGLELALPPRAVERKNSLDSAASPAAASCLSSMTTPSPPPAFSPPIGGDLTALTTPPNLTTSSSRLGPAPSLDLATPPSSDVNASPHLPAAPAIDRKGVSVPPWLNRYKSALQVHTTADGSPAAAAVGMPGLKRTSSWLLMPPPPARQAPPAAVDGAAPPVVPPLLLPGEAAGSLLCREGLEGEEAVAAPAAAPPRSSITKRKYAILVADGTAAAADDTDTLTTLSPPTSTPPTIAPAPMAHREDATAAALWTRRMRGAGEQPDAGAPSSAPTSTEW